MRLTMNLGKQIKIEPDPETAREKALTIRPTLDIQTTSQENEV